MSYGTFHTNDPVDVDILGDRSQAVVTRSLDSGAQGEVYEAQWEGHSVALKWYRPSLATEAQRASIMELIRRRSPHRSFIWPMGLATVAGETNFGYIMPLLESRFVGMHTYMQGQVEPSFQARATAGYHLARSFLKLHTAGFCYRDINFNNIFFDPDSGDIRIIDNDNVAINGQPAGNVLGTYRFMAPEVLRGAPPSTDTDLYSLAVLLFYIFMLHHPLDGAREVAIHALNEAAMRRLYGDEPVFIFDPDDDSNRPDPLYHQMALRYWPIYPQFLRDRFVQAFSTGIRNPRHGRVRESVWQRDMVNLRDAIMYCGHCHAETFYDASCSVTCWSCEQTVIQPPRLEMEHNVTVMLNPDTRLFPHHIDGGLQRYNFSAPVAEVSQHPQKPDVWGLHNLSGRTWTALQPDGCLLEVESGRVCRLRVNTVIDFGNTRGTILWAGLNAGEDNDG